MNIPQMSFFTHLVGFFMSILNCFPFISFVSNIQWWQNTLSSWSLFSMFVSSIN